MRKESGSGARHFHCNDWREMLALVNSSKMSVTNCAMQTDKVKICRFVSLHEEIRVKENNSKLKNDKYIKSRRCLNILYGKHKTCRNIEE